MGMFIEIEIDDERMSPESAKAVFSVCPVEIFTLRDGRLVTLADQEDECTLCELCLDVAPAGSLTICKKYKNETLVSRGNHSEAQLGVTAECSLNLNS